MHLYSKRTTIEKGLKLGDIEILPKPLVRYLGVFLDSKLIFVSDLVNRGTSMV